MDRPAFGPVRQIDAGVLNVGYVEVGPADGQPVVLLHGWPYDIHSYADAAPALGDAGYRVVVPYLRGYGTTRFLSDHTLRNGQQSALALDVIELMDALDIDTAVVAGFDWGARSANIVAALWPERCKAMVSVSGYLIGNQAAGIAPLPPPAELSWWYQFYFATERGRAGYDTYRHDFAKLIWHTASPDWHFDDETFERSASAFDNPDHVDIVIDNYRWRLGLTPGERQYDDLRAAARHRTAHHGAHHHPRRRRQRRSSPRSERLQDQVHRHVLTPNHLRRSRTQPSPRSPAPVRRRHHRRRRVLALTAAAVGTRPRTRRALVSRRATEWPMSDGWLGRAAR